MNLNSDENPYAPPGALNPHNGEATAERDVYELARYQRVYIWCMRGYLGSIVLLGVIVFSGFFDNHGTRLLLGLVVLPCSLISGCLAGLIVGSVHGLLRGFLTGLLALHPATSPISFVIVQRVAIKRLRSADLPVGYFFGGLVPQIDNMVRPSEAFDDD